MLCSHGANYVPGTVLTALHLWDDLTSQHLYEASTIITLVLQIKKVRLRGVMQLAQGLKDRKYKDLNVHLTNLAESSFHKNVIQKPSYFFFMYL